MPFLKSREFAALALIFLAAPLVIAGSSPDWAPYRNAMLIGAFLCALGSLAIAVAWVVSSLRYVEQPVDGWPQDLSDGPRA